MKDKKKLERDEFKELVIESKRKEKINKKKTEYKWMLKIVLIAFIIIFWYTYYFVIYRYWYII